VVVDYYKLAEQPFGVTPNPRYLYMTATHREAMASIFYGLMENRGFSALIAPPGMGKTTLLFELLNRCGQSMRTIFLFQFQPNPEVLLRNLLAELGILHEGEDFAGMQEKLNQTILQEAKKGKRIVVVVDEAQTFPEPVLEALRMLSNFETSRDKLLHIILSGQPQLAEMLFSSSIEQLRQRISIMAVLQPLNAKETRNYIEYRLRVAGYKSGRPLFTSAAFGLIAEYSGGIPRKINNYCFNAMSLGFALKQPTIGREIIDEVFRDLNLEGNSGHGVQDGRLRANSSAIGLARRVLPQAPSTGGWPRLVLGALSIAALVCLAGVFASDRLNYLPSQLKVAVPAPPAPVIATETPAPTATEPTEAVAKAETESAVQSKPEAEPKVESKPESSGARNQQVQQIRPVQEVVHSDPPIAKQERVRLVKAWQHETVYQLCVRNLARCDAGALRKIQQLNPWLHNASELQPGQPVRVPLEVPGKRGHKARFAKSDFGAKR